MKARNEQIREEATALWRELRGGPPPEGADGQQILDMIIQGLPEASYGRLRNPHLRRVNVALPRR